MLRSLPCSSPGRRAYEIPLPGGISGVTVTSRAGRVWQARRTLGGAWMRASACASSDEDGGSAARPSLMRTRQVVQRARPPQLEACGRPASRTASRMLRPTGATMMRPEAWCTW